MPSTLQWFQPTSTTAVIRGELKWPGAYIAATDGGLLCTAQADINLDIGAQ